MKKIFWLVSALICSAFIASCVHGTSDEPAGIPSIKLSPENQSVVVGGSYVATLTLSNYTESATIAVSLTSNNTNIATVSPVSCNLSKTTTTCNVTITAVSTGTAQVTAVATGYTIEPASVTVFTPPSIHNDNSLIFASFSGVNYAYITDDKDSLYQCSLNNLGNFTSCTVLTPSGAVFNYAKVVQFESFSGVTYAYVADTSQNIWQCRMNATGQFDGACIIANPDFTFHQTQAITFASFNGVTYGYVADYSNTIWQCPVNNVTGQFNSPCTALNSGSVTPFGLSWSITIALFNGVNYGYVATGDSFLWQCPMDANGDFSNQCTQLSYDSRMLGSVREVVFQSFVSGVTYGYITTSGNNDGRGIWRCQMNNTGEFSTDTCTHISNSGLSVIQPISVTFESFVGTTYGYFQSKDMGIEQCPMNTVGEITGQCVMVARYHP